MQANKPRVLVVDDSATIRQQVQVALMPESIEVMAASNGNEALSLLRSSDPPISLALVDLNMPGMNGFELMRRIRAVEELEQPKLLVFTTEHSRALLKEAREAGALGWISKPTDGATLARAVMELIDQ